MSPRHHWRPATGVDCTMSIRLQVSRCYSSRWEALPAPHYTKREVLLSGLLVRRARELLSELSSLRKTKGSFPSAHCQGARAGTRAVALSSFFLSLTFFFSQTGKWFCWVNSVTLKCHKLNKLVHIFFLSQHLNYSKFLKHFRSPL